MTDPNDAPKTRPAYREAARFWERGRLLYNAILAAVVLLWLALTWPHFRPSLTLGSFEAFIVLALGANLCYSSAYVVELFLQPFLTSDRLRRVRQIVWLLGMLFALVLANYWIADEIYPYATQPPPPIIGAGTVGGGTTMPTVTFASNMNFPAPLAVMGFLAAAAGLVVGASAALIFWLARKPKFARIVGITIGTGAVAYLALLFGMSVSSRATILARGEEKYFCEIDCHLAYSVVEVRKQPDASSTHYLITLRTRFDETTTSPSRPKDATLTPSPREVRLIDSAGTTYSAASTQGTPLLTPLKPSESYTTQLEFNVPNEATGLRLLINTTPGWPDHLVIGDENSWLHKKTYFAVLPSLLTI